MKNDITWEHSGSSEQDTLRQQRKARMLERLSPHGATPTLHCIAPLPDASQARSHGDPSAFGAKPFLFPPSSFLSADRSLPNAKTISTLQRRKAYIINKLARMRAVPQQKKAWLYEEATALTRILHFLFVMLKTVPPEQLEKLRNLKAIEDGLLPDTQESVRLRDPGFPDALRGTLAALRVSG
jgi:hypothetical protein